MKARVEDEIQGFLGEIGSLGMRFGCFLKVSSRN